MQPPQGYGPPGGYGGPGGWGPSQPPGGGFGQPPGGYGPPGGGYGPPPGGGYGAPPPPPPPRKPDSGMSPAVIALIVLVIVGVLGIGSCVLCVGIGALGSSKPSAPPPPKRKATVFVSCDGSPFSGFTCTVSHTSGNGRANACWDVKVSCHNGALVTGHACQVIAPLGKATRILRAGDLRSTRRCDGSAGTTVENVTVTVLN